MNELVEKARNYAREAHAKTNHRYDEEGANLPYDFHLRSVYSYAAIYINLIPKKYHDIVFAACWCHDLIEDARQSYNDVCKNIGKEVAEIVYACTNLRGKTRAERAGAEYYKLIRETPYADFVKICDRLANVKYSSGSHSNLLDCYRIEQSRFGAELYKPEYKPMFDELSELLSK